MTGFPAASMIGTQGSHGPLTIAENNPGALSDSGFFLCIFNHLASVYFSIALFGIATNSRAATLLAAAARKFAPGTRSTP
ncbi:hypothetical protein KT71_000548 [Congregibacter litoralis KT71]|uniref:Uncharacterized protein n=1 Tax=Congregibacter litoralis KT71 TaxID=314285 RepID=V7HT25_9GAMM|nr:hypothetical protein KT71_000548 [Congregibacter litoralis KT71]